MSRLRRVESSQMLFFQGYLDAAGHAFTKGELDIGLEATLLEIGDSSVTDDDVVGYVYSDEFNPVDDRLESTVEEMVTAVNALMTIARQYVQPQYSFADRLESNLRDGYWRHLEACFDYKRAGIFKLGRHVPYVNIGEGFTYILYAPDMSRCMLLVGNSSD